MLNYGTNGQSFWHIDGQQRCKVRYFLASTMINENRIQSHTPLVIHYFVVRNSLLHADPAVKSRPRPGICCAHDSIHQIMGTTSAKSSLREFVTSWQSWNLHQNERHRLVSATIELRWSVIPTRTEDRKRQIAFRSIFLIV